VDRTLGNDIAELVGELESTEFSTCSIQCNGDRLYLRRPVASVDATQEAAKDVQGEGASGGGRQENLLCSPRVGHFFPRTGKQAGEPYRPGDVIEAGEVYGRIEAMHLKFELRADRSGVVQKFLAVEGEAVEFGQPLVALMQKE
jgi:biotin carboxyl carrier protein